MKKGTYIYAEDVVQNLTFLNIAHHLKITEECFKYLLNIMREQLETRQPVQGCLFGKETEVREIVGLCRTNAELMDSMQELLLKEDLNERDLFHVHAGDRRNMMAEEPGRQFRESIVGLMLISLQCWEQCTRKTKIELAEESRIWRINIDGGRLRVRSMDRYLSIAKLPKVPRWRDVLKTAYFVLDHAEPDSSIKRKLEQSLEHTLRIMRLNSH